MITGLLGKKIGMTHVFADEGRMVPVTVIELGPCVVTQLRTHSNDGYEAVQIGFGDAKRLNKPEQGHQKKANAKVRNLREFDTTDLSQYQVGQKLDVRNFYVGETVHVSAESKGRGFQGGVKRHNFRGGPKTHGQGDRHRAPGSIGSTTYIGRVNKGRRMAGHMGAEQVTVRNLKVVRVDADRNLLLVYGAVPGATNALITVRHADTGAAAKAYEELLKAEPVKVEAPQAEAVELEPVKAEAAPVDETPEAAEEGKE